MGLNIRVSARVNEKLQTKHSVTVDEIREAFANIEGQFLIDDREDNKTDPQTNWFIAETDKGRCLKVYFIAEKDEKGRSCITIKTAYEANITERRIYERKGLN